MIEFDNALISKNDISLITKHHRGSESIIQIKSISGRFDLTEIFDTIQDRDKRFEQLKRDLTIQAIYC